MRIVIAALLFVASCTAAAAQGCGSTNPNCIVPTAPPGTSDNRAASTAFVQSSASGSAVKGPASSTIGDVPTFNNSTGTLIADPSAVSANAQDFYFGTGRPWFDVRAFGAKGDGATDDTTAAQRAENAAAAAGFGGATVYWPPGTYCLNGGLVISGNDIRNVGASVAGSYVRVCNSSDITVFHLEGTRDTIEHLSIDGANLTTTNHAAVWADTGAVNAKLYDVLIHYGVYGFLDQAADVVVRDSTIAYSYNSNVAATAGDGLYFLRSTVDQGTPNGTTCTAIGSWIGTSSVSAGDCKTVGSFVIQYTHAGTTGGSSPTVLPYLQNITDGTATAQLMAPASFIGMLLQTTVNFIEDSDFSGPFTRAGIEINNSAQGNVISHSILTAVGSGSASAIRLSSGNQVLIDGNSLSCAISGCLGLNVTTGWTGDGTFTNNTAFAIAQQCFIIQAGTHYTLSGNITGNCGEGLYVAAGVTSVSSTNNVWGGDTQNGANTVGILLATGNSDYIQTTNDDLKAASTPITNGSTGTHNLICNDAGSSTCSWPTGTILPVAAGGTGASTLTGIVVGSGTSALAATQVTGAVKDNGSGTLSQAACADLSNAAASCSTDATNAGNISSGTLAVARGGTGQTSIAGIQAATNQGLLTFETPAVNFNSANTDNQINITLPTGFSRYRILSMTISGASASISTATFGVFSGTGGTGTVLVNSATAITVTASAENTANNMQFITVNNNNTASYNFSSIQFRVVGAQGSAATAAVAITIQPVS